jgi:hypothetical protein
MLHQNIQKQDFYALITFLYEDPILQHILIPSIHRPFTNDLKEQM